MPPTRPLAPLVNVTQTTTPITNGNTYTHRFSTTDAIGQFVSVVGSASIINQKSCNMAITVGTYALLTAALSTTTFASSGTGLGTGWVLPVGTFIQETSNGVNICQSTTRGFAAAYNNAHTYLNDHTVTMTMPAVIPPYRASTTAVGPAARMSTNGQTFYWFAYSPLGWSLKKYVANVVTTLASGSRALTGNDVLAISVIGPSVVAFINGVLVASVHDTDIAVGIPGIATISNLSPTLHTYVPFPFKMITISSPSLKDESTVYTNANVGTRDSSGRLPMVVENSVDGTTPTTATKLVSGSVDEAKAAYPSGNLATVFNSWLSAKGVI